ncbi:hypothetical protein GM50_16420 [freshwater metagenome]|uniref:LemA family protein n=1 Tax=freshwater metagenome TaxID=449393 RepID=A0A094PXA1_9ZZZZ
MKSYILYTVLAVLVFWYLTFSASRLDRLHHRVETSWATLDSLLQRRAAIALEVARSAITDPATSLLLTASAYQARSADIEDRSSAESVLSGALGMMLSERESIVAKSDQALLAELEQLTDKIKVSIAIHVEAVNRTQLIRRKLVFRVFRLAGTAPLPVTYEFEADAI